MVIDNKYIWKDHALSSEIASSNERQMLPLMNLQNYPHQDISSESSLYFELPPNNKQDHIPSNSRLSVEVKGLPYESKLKTPS